MLASLRSSTGLAVVLLTLHPASATEGLRTVLPKDPCVIDAKRDLGAKGDGVADDTEALQRGLDETDQGAEKRTRVLYLPNGTYRVTKSLVYKHTLGPWLYGESRDGVVIKLDDGVQGVTAVLRTHPNETGPTSADWFMRNLRNFTIDVGRNPDTDGIRYFSNNSGCLKNVRVIGNGKVGINAGFRDQSGPNLIQDCTIEGFETGIVSQWIWGETISRVTIKKCRKVGLFVSANSVAVEQLVVEDTPQAIHVHRPEDWNHWAGVVALVGGRFRGGDPKQPAIRNEGVLYLRDVQAEGFGLLVESPLLNKTLPGLKVAEFSSHPVKRLFDPGKEQPKLEIQPEPAVAWETDLSQWVCANDFGAQAGDNVDDTAAIQRAIDAAAKNKQTVVYLRGCGGPDPNWYTVGGEIKVHGSVRWILGLGWGRIIREKEGRFVVTDNSAPVVKFQHIDSFGGPPVILENRSSNKTLVVESCSVRILGTGTGNIFVTDSPSLIELRRPGQKVWCRQLNPEGEIEPALVNNAGADLWILGMKFEGRGTRVRTSNGGRTEAFGVFNYGPGIPEGDQRPMFDVEDASFAVFGLRELSFAGNCYRVKVREKRGSTVRLLGDDQEPGWIGWSAYDAWSPPSSGRRR
ncbi:MAG: glycoside hydrolase family 55 protein [Gemmataceae bacterium]|nr:glycoside hydrolase family 55 protein [Gemmataceae bacterium]